MGVHHERSAGNPTWSINVDGILYATVLTSEATVALRGKGRLSAVADAEWLSLSRAVVNSPLVRRDLRVSASEIRSVFQTARPVESLLTGGGRRWWMSMAPAVFGTRLTLRRTPTRIGEHWFPKASEVEGLLSIAADELPSIDPWQRVGLAGLALLAVHPYVDGNGRSARFIWLKGMLDLGMTPIEAVDRLQEFFGAGGLAVLPTLEAAHNGAIDAFTERWRAAVRE